MVDLDREQNIEELRRIAHAQQAQIRILLEALQRQAAEQALAKAEAANRDKVERKPRSSAGPTEQTRLPIVEREFELDDADRTSTSSSITSRSNVSVESLSDMVSS